MQYLRMLGAGQGKSGHSGFNSVCEASSQTLRDSCYLFLDFSYL